MVKELVEQHNVDPESECDDLLFYKWVQSQPGVMSMQCCLYTLGPTDWLL